MSTPTPAASKDNPRAKARRARMRPRSALVGAVALALLCVAGAAMLLGGQAREAGSGVGRRAYQRSHRSGLGSSLTLKLPAPAEAVDYPVVAWQPSHQGDTGADGWQEYVMCGDIVDRTMTLLTGWRQVKAWDTSHGLTGSNAYRPQPTNTPAFDAELALANESSAEIFVSIHNDGAAPSGILGVYLPGDEQGRALAAALVASLVAETGLPDRGLREMQLYSLEPERNHASVRCLLEIGDNAADRAYLESPGGRQQIAVALAKGMRGYVAASPASAR